MDKNCTDHSLFYSENPNKFGLNLLTSSKVIAVLILTKFTRDLIEVRHLLYYSR
jgi:hypothetical protein